MERFSPRNFYDVLENLDKEPIVKETYQEEATGEFTIVIDLDNLPSLLRDESVPLKSVPSSVVHAGQSTSRSNVSLEDFIDDDNEVHEYKANASEEDEAILSDSNTDLD